MQVPQFSMPVMTDLPKDALSRNTSSSKYDHKALAKEIAKEVGCLKDIPGIDVRTDKNGIFIIAKEGIDRTEFLNSKYSIKK